MTAVSEQIGNWVEQFTGQPASAFQPLREAAFKRFAELGFPTTRDEEWRFTNVAPIARGTFTAATPQAPGDIDQLAPWTAGNRLVFVNGQLTETVVDLPKGVQIGDLNADAEPYLAKQAGFDKNAFVALNTAFLNQGAFIRVARGTVVEQAIHIVYVTLGQGVQVQPRALIVVGPDAQCTIVETYVGAGSYFTNAVTEVVASNGAVVDHYKVTVEAPSAYHVATLQATLGKSTNFSSYSISLGGALIRNDAGATLSEGTEASLQNPCTIIETASSAEMPRCLQ